MKKRTYIIHNEMLRRRLIAFLAEIDVTKPKQIVISDYVRKRSTNQNSLYWMMLTQIADDTGHTKDEMHEFFARQFLTPQTIEMGDVVMDIPPSTTKLSTVDFSEYIERITAFAGTELGLMLHMP